jgi:hypothetical protein
MLNQMVHALTNVLQTVNPLNERETERKDSEERERHDICGRTRKIFLISDFESSQKMWTRPSGRRMFERGLNFTKQRTYINPKEVELMFYCVSTELKSYVNVERLH